MPPLVTQILLKIATLFCVWVCTKLHVSFTQADLAETSTWFVSLAIGVASFVWATWRHKAALDAAKTTTPPTSTIRPAVMGTKLTRPEFTIEEDNE